MAQFISCKALLCVRQQVFVGQVGAEKRRIVGVERNQQSLIEKPAQWVQCKRWADAGADIRGRIQLQRNRALLQVLQQVKILRRREGVADALRTDGQRLANRLRAGGLAGVVGEPQPGPRRLGIERAEGLGAGPALVAAQADADDRRVLRSQLDGFAEDALGLLNA